MPSPWVTRAQRGELPGKSYDALAPAERPAIHVILASHCVTCEEDGDLLVFVCQDCWQRHDPDSYAPDAAEYGVCDVCGEFALLYDVCGDAFGAFDPYFDD